ncbi:hypothetical protein Cs7R123_19430 [Catellatospora sp. TT07R-123]|uniref:hypothetical protein n=1 Tax=Catellatospora sp. TT07R-123 TaxID=2733863 RepID=UPI001B2765A1|nr:hypothetical protein [Catellatospora sp. TT07R-123]GHJ44601.1 hypothetical protein Cs7R123_19430 [Catellatospora sp. TT07R-123]
MIRRVRPRVAAPAIAVVLLAAAAAVLYGFPPGAAQVAPAPAALPSAYRLDPVQPPLPVGAAAGTGVAPGFRTYFHLLHRGGRPFAQDSVVTENAVIRFAGSEQVGMWGAGVLRSPHGLALGLDYHLWVADAVLNQVIEFDADGRELRRIGADHTGALDACLRVRTVLSRLPCTGDPYVLDQPADVTVAPDGSVFVADGFRGARIAHFAADGTFLNGWGSLGDGPDQLNLLSGIAYDQWHELVYVADRRNARVSVFRPDGTPVAQWRAAALGRPCDVYVTPDAVWVLDGGDRLDDPDGDPLRQQVVKLDFGGRVLDRFGWPAGTGYLGLEQLAADWTGATVYVAASEGRPIHRFVKG